MNKQAKRAHTKPRGMVLKSPQNAKKHVPKLHLHEPVLLTQDIPELHLQAGMEGWIVDLLDESGRDYEVEFSDAAGNTVYMGALSAALLEPLPPEHTERKIS